MSITLIIGCPDLSLSQVYREETTIDGKSYFQDVVFDSSNQFRIKKSYDASSGNGGIEYQYNNDNYLIGKTDLVSGTKVWELLKTDAWGNATEFNYGNGIKTTKVYDDYDGTIGSITAVDLQKVSIQNSEYDFTNVGNLDYRTDHFTGFTEDFTYDSLNRLDDWTKSGGGASGLIDVNYDSLGNIEDKTGVGTYHYENSPHAVSRISDGSLTGNFTYDGNGNMTSGGGRSNITYNVNNKPLSITAGSHKTKFVYSIGGARIKRSDSKGGNTTDTLYMGNVEFVSKNGKLLRMQRTIEGIAIETFFANTQKRNLEYLHFDHLGSAEVITTAEENPIDIVVKRFSFDPWGQRRSIDNYNTTYGFTNGLSLSLDYYTKGFTGHEHMDESGLIHMNGRIYDPRLGRFLNADPIVQQPYNLQNLNRYSYVLNNPLNATDPSGYSATLIAGFIAGMLAANTTIVALKVAYAIYAIYSAVNGIYDGLQAMKYNQGVMGAIQMAMSAWSLYSTVSNIGGDNSLGETKNEVKVGDRITHKTMGSGDVDSSSKPTLEQEAQIKTKAIAEKNVLSKARDSLTDPSSEGYKLFAHNNGYSSNDDFSLGAKELENMSANIDKSLSSIIDDPSQINVYQTTDPTDMGYYNESTGKIAMSNQYLSSSDSTSMIHEVQHKLGYDHHWAGRGALSGLTKTSHNARQYVGPIYGSKSDLLQQSLDRALLLKDVYNFDYSLQGIKYK